MPRQSSAHAMELRYCSCAKHALATLPQAMHVREHATMQSQLPVICNARTTSSDDEQEMALPSAYERAFASQANASAPLQLQAFERAATQLPFLRLLTPPRHCHSVLAFAVHCGRCNASVSRTGNAELPMLLCRAEGSEIIVTLQAVETSTFAPKNRYELDFLLHSVIIENPQALQRSDEKKTVLGLYTREPRLSSFISHMTHMCSFPRHPKSSSHTL